MPSLAKVDNLIDGKKDVNWEKTGSRAHARRSSKSASFVPSVAPKGSTGGDYFRVSRSTTFASNTFAKLATDLTLRCVVPDPVLRCVVRLPCGPRTVIIPRLTVYVPGCFTSPRWMKILPESALFSISFRFLRFQTEGAPGPCEVDLGGCGRRNSRGEHHSGEACRAESSGSRTRCCSDRIIEQ